jgi:hypothetical protein
MEDYTMSPKHREEVIPSAARLLGSLRGLGYNFSNAVADIVDNSVVAGASRVDITVEFAGAASWVRIADDGEGMNGSQISEAMRLGSSSRDYRSDDLGKFGLGLKTASLSQARSITVASRTSQTRRQIECRILDLDDVVERDQWEIIHPAAAERSAEIVEPLADGPGTVVLWSKLDRVLERNDPFGGWAHRLLLGLARDLDRHLGMVFGRFISGQARSGRKLAIAINGTKVEAWDPFCLNERTEHLPVKELLVAGSVVRWRPFVLPPQRDFSDDEAWKNASGPRQWNHQQGLYIYRADRMIQSGGWSWLRGADEHTKLARAALEFWPVLDDTFEIDVSKMRVKLPEELREQLKPLVSFLTKRADERYRAGNKGGRPAPPRPPSRPKPAPTAAQTGAGAPTTPLPDASPVRPGSNGLDVGTGRTPGFGQTTLPSARRAAAALEAAAERTGALAALGQIRAELLKTDPGVAHELGW